LQIACLDLEGVLVPEIWIEFSKRTGIAELARTTRDEPDYDKHPPGITRGLPDIRRRFGQEPLPTQGGSRLAPRSAPGPDPFRHVL
jgi:phosphoserine/homoserine phosphotransferase